MRTYILLPAYSEEKIIKDVIKDIKAAGFENIIVIDDGSPDDTCAQAKSTGVIVIKTPNK